MQLLSAGFLCFGVYPGAGCICTAFTIRGLFLSPQLSLLPITNQLVFQNISALCHRPVMAFACPSSPAIVVWSPWVHQCGGWCCSGLRWDHLIITRITNSTFFAGPPF